MPTRSVRPFRWIWPACAASGVILSLVYQLIVVRTLWLDEEMIALNIRDRSLADLAGPLWLGQSAPFGWLALERLMVVLLGASDTAVRSVPIAFAIATVGVAFWIGRRWLEPVGATVLVVLSGLSTWVALYAVEVKPYSADMFWALFLPGLAAWAATPTDRSDPPRARLALWWAAAAVGQWFANGATLATPASAVTLFVIMTRRCGRRGFLSVASPGLVWIAAFGLHYWVSIRHALGSDYLQVYWRFAFPPRDAGLIGTLQWLVEQIKPLGIKPGGTDHWALFWMTSIAGLVLVSRKTTVLGFALALIPASAFVLAAVRAVPLYERLSLWIMPALFVGVGAAADGAIQLVARPGRPYRLATRIVGMSLALAVALVCWDTVASGWVNLGTRFSRTAGNHSLDDRSAVGVVTSRLQTNDVVLTTQYGLPAVWWYGRSHVGEPDQGRVIGAQRNPIVQVDYLGVPGCRSDLREALGTAARAFVFLGFRFDDVPRGFDGQLLDELRTLGDFTEYREFAEVGRVAVIDLRPSSSPPQQLRQRFDENQPLLPGCLRARVGRRWS